MPGIYLLLALITQFSSGNILASIASAPAQVYISFDQLNGIGVGSPVVVEGEVIGSVTNVSPVAETASSKADTSAMHVEISVKPEHREVLKLGTVALTFAPLIAGKKKSDAVVELFVPHSGNKLLADGANIRGYSSYEQFWSAGGSDFRLHPDSLFKS